ncbi:MAG: ABC transporter permease [Actinomycetota bacterium]|nr:ABC transporter permease [Actinomycetota bacterium]
MTQSLAGTGPLVRLILRRDRVRLPVWILGIVGLVYASAGAVSAAYPTQKEVDAYAATFGESPAGIAMSGPPTALDSIGGIVIFEVNASAMIAISLMSIFLVVRHTRAEEEEGRTELLRSAVVGRHAAATSALMVVSGATLLVGLGIAASLASADVPLAGAVLFGASVTALGIVFAAIAGCAAQITTHARGATGLATAVLGASFVLRAAGDVGNGLLSWFSPIGWSQATRPIDDDRWEVLLVPSAAAVLLTALMVTLTNRRDIGSGIVAARPGPAEAAPGLSGAFGLALRLQRGSIAGWAAGLLLGGVAFGSVAREVQDMVADNPQLAEYFQSAEGASLLDSFFATAYLVLSLVSAGFAVASVLRMRSEEASGRLEPLLATGLSRSRWVAGSLLVTFVGTVTVVLAGGLGVGIASALVQTKPAAMLLSVGYAAAYLPAVLTLAAVTLLLFGWLPRCTSVAWALVAGCFVIGWLGGVLDIPSWLEQTTPFTHTPMVPAEPVTVTPLAVLTALIAGAVVAGVLGLKRRDIA